jgi:hypothetical protein
MTNHIFMVRNMFCPHKDYSSFLGGKLIMFKLCNYGIMLAKVSRVIFRVFWLILLFMRLILLLVNFCRTIRLQIFILLFMTYFVVYD